MRNLKSLLKELRRTWLEAWNIKSAELVSVEDDGMEKVYDITMPFHHNFFANNHLVHNCHHVDFLEEDSQYMRIINHFRKLNPKLLIFGATGSPFRGTDSIIGSLWDDCLIRVTTDYAIREGFLVPPQFGFPPDEATTYDYSDVEPDSKTGDYTSTDLARVAKEQECKLTPIMREVVQASSKRNVTLIFAASKKHCEQIADHLPDGEWAIVTDSTPFKERQKIIDDAKSLKLRYIINVGVMITGVNIPTIDCIVYLRAVGSLVLLIQSIGRGLRLCPQIDKRDCLILDYTETMVRLGELYNNPILEQAELERSKANGNTKICPNCQTVNGEFARRCRGNDMLSSDGRCEYFWDSITCERCGTENDIVARECRGCGAEIRDPNEKLVGKAYTDTDWKPVQRMDMKVTRDAKKVIVLYFLPDGEVGREIINPNPKKPWEFRVLAKFMHDHINCSVMRKRVGQVKNAGAIVAQKAVFDAPTHITHRVNDSGLSIIHNKRFLSGREATKK